MIREQQQAGGAEASDAPQASGRLRRKRLVIVATACALAAATAFVVTAVLVATHPSAPVASGGGGGSGPTLVTYARAKQAPAGRLDLPRLGGGAGRFTLSALGKRPFVVNFFASWCTACQAELKAVAGVANAERGKVPFFGVDTNETSTRQAVRMLHSVHAVYPVGIGTTAQANEFLVPGLPTTVFVNGSGRVVATVYGAVTQAELSAWVGELASGRPLHSLS